jgi:RNA polymerase sigma-70 factor (ECF subfamily)
MTVKEYNRAVDLFSDGIFRFVIRSMSDQETAKDIVQDSYVRLWDKHTEIDFEKCKSYLFTTAYHLIVDIVRKNKNKLMYLQSKNWEPALTSEFTDLKQVLSQALDRLPEIQRTVILLRDYEGYSYEEIGEITQLNESQVKVYIYRARKALKTYIVNVDVVI